MTARIPRLSPAALDPGQRAVYDTIVGGPRASGVQHFALTDAAGGLNGPFNAFLLAPPVGSALQAVGAALRYSTAMSDRLREAAILLVATHWHSAFEWHAHEGAARAAGLTDADLDEIRAGRVPALEDPAEAAGLEAVVALLRGDLPDEQWSRTVSLLGEPIIFELSTLVGYYATLALQLRVFRAERDE